MARSKLLLIAVSLCLIIVVLSGACTETSPNVDVPSEFREAAEARGTVLAYLQANVGKQAPSPDAEWQAQAIILPALVSRRIVEFHTDGWVVRVSWVSSPSDRTYQVLVLNNQLGWHWEGMVEPDRNISEVSPFYRVSEEESLECGEVKSAIMDERWDMISQKFLLE